MPDQKYILIAEDDKAYANVFRTKLTKEGYEIEIVSNGEDVLKKIHEKKPDLIILDLMMPIMNGFETLQNIREDHALKDIKIIIASSLGQEDDVEKAKKLGIEGYFIKAETSIHDLVEKIKQYLQ